MPDSLQVNLGQRSYPIRFGDDLSEELGSRLGALREEGRKLVIVTDETIVTAQSEGSGKNCGSGGDLPCAGR